MKPIIGIAGSILAMLCIGIYLWLTHFGPAEDTLLTEMLLHNGKGKVIIRRGSGNWNGDVQTRLYVRDLGLSGAPLIYLRADDNGEYGPHRGKMFCSSDGYLFLIEVFDHHNDTRRKRLVGYDFYNHIKVVTANADALLAQRGGNSLVVIESSTERRPRYWELKAYSALE